MLAYFLLWQFRRGMTECSGCDSCALCLNVLLSFKRCLWLVLNNCHVLGLRLTGPFNGCVILKSKPSIDVRCLVLLTYRGSLRGSVPNSARRLLLFFFFLYKAVRLVAASSFLHVVCLRLLRYLKNEWFNVCRFYMESSSLWPEDELIRFLDLIKLKVTQHNCRYTFSLNARMRLWCICTKTSNITSLCCFKKQTWIWNIF